MHTLLDRWASGPGRPTRPAGEAIDSLDRGRYRIQDVLGRGAFGITYAAEDTRLRRPVAIKELFPPGCLRVGGRVVAGGGAGPDQAGLAAMLQRFVGEAENLARFTHVGIVRIYELIE